MIENFKYAARNGDFFWIGGGEFGPRDLARVAALLYAGHELFRIAGLVANAGTRPDLAERLDKALLNYREALK